MQVTKGTWRMHKQCVPGSLSSSPAQEPGNEATVVQDFDIGMLLQLDESLMAHPAPKHAIATEWGYIMQTLVAVLPLAASEVYLLHM